MNVFKKISEETKSFFKELKKGIDKTTISKKAGSSADCTPSGGGGPMKFPYTYTAKIVQFPWKYYIKNNWVFRYYFISVILCIPIFKKIENVFNSPYNVQKWEEIKRKEREEEHH